MVIQETRGQPDGLLVCHLPLGPTAYFTLSDVVMRHDIEDRGTVSEAYPHLILNGFESQLGKGTVAVGVTGLQPTQLYTRSWPHACCSRSEAASRLTTHCDLQVVVWRTSCGTCSRSPSPTPSAW